jgi:hypothetical protein
MRHSTRWVKNILMCVCECVYVLCACVCACVYVCDAVGVIEGESVIEIKSVCARVCGWYRAVWGIYDVIKPHRHTHTHLLSRIVRQYTNTFSHTHTHTRSLTCPHRACIYRYFLIHTHTYLPFPHRTYRPAPPPGAGVCLPENLCPLDGAGRGTRGCVSMGVVCV